MDWMPIQVVCFIVVLAILYYLAPPTGWRPHPKRVKGDV